MRITKEKPERDIRFAWLPVRTDEGLVWLEHVHFQWVEGWGWGSSGFYVYQRMIPQDRYDAGERKPSSAKAYGHQPGCPECEANGVCARHVRYATPPGDPATFCKNYRTDGPTPCHWPHCRWVDDPGINWQCNGKHNDV